MLSANASSFLVLAALVVAFGLIMRRSLAAQATSDRRDTGLTRFNRLKPTSYDHESSVGFPPEFVRWQVELEQSARELTKQIDAKSAALQTLIEAADHAAQRLETAIERARSIPGFASGDSLANIEKLADPAALADPSVFAEVASSLPSLQHTAADPFEENERSLKLARLADDGLSAAEIAARLGLPIGEVELRLNLRSA